MAIYHLCVKAISRSKGRSATAAAAYRNGSKIYDERIGLNFDYTRKRNVDHVEMINTSFYSERFWNDVEQTEKRKNSTVAREVEFALPIELNNGSKIELAKSFCQALADNYNVAGELSVHHIDGDNPHCHFLFSTREYTNGKLGKKTRMLDDKTTGKEEVEKIRSSWATVVNQYLLENGIDQQLDHRSYKRQKIDQIPSNHHRHKHHKQGNYDSEQLHITRTNQLLKKLKVELKIIQNELKRLTLQVINKSKHIRFSHKPSL